MQTLTRPKHPAPSLQKALSQNFRADQATAGNAAAIAVGKLWAHGFSIRNARSSWATIRPAIVAICKKYYLGNQAKGQAYYNACRLSAGLGTLPDLGWVRVSLQNEKLAKTIDPCGLGAFLHQVKGGAQMMDAFNSGHDSLMQAVQQLVLSGARDWIEAAAKADPDSEGIRRVTGGTCDYCEDLASQGVTVADQGWHNDCECTSEPAFNGDTGPSPSLPDSGVAPDDGGDDEFETTSGDIPSDPDALIDRIDSEQGDVEGSIKDAIASGDKGTAATDAQGQVAQTVIKEFNDGSKYISKDVSSKYKNIVRDNTRQIPSEQGASIVARALGLDSPNIVQTGAEQMMMPFYPGGTVIAEGDEERLVADGLQELFGKSTEQDSILGRVGLLDSLIGNTDRNLGNLVRDADGKLIPIDHGESSFKDFNVEGSKLTEVAQSNGVKFSKEDFQAIKANIEAIRGKIEAIKGPDGYGRQQIGLYMYKGLMRNLTTAMSSYGGWS